MNSSSPEEAGSIWRYSGGTEESSISRKARTDANVDIVANCVVLGGVGTTVAVGDIVDVDFLIAGVSLRFILVECMAGTLLDALFAPRPPVVLEVVANKESHSAVSKSTAT